MDSRAYRRVIVDRDVECWINDEAGWAFIYDLSCGGCMVEASGFVAKQGDSIRIRLAEVTDVGGTVAWQIGPHLGIRFDVTVPASYVERLGFSPNSGRFEFLVPRDRFGRPLGPLKELPRIGARR